MAHFHTTAVICQEEGAVKETVSVPVCACCVCVVCVCVLASCEEGRKTITTHLAAAVAAYTGGKETPMPLRQPAAQTDTYSPDRRREAHTSADGMSVMVDTGKRRAKRGMFTTKS